MRPQVSHFIALLIVLSSIGCLTNQSGEEVNPSVDSDLDRDGIPDEIDDDQDGDGWAGDWGTDLVLETSKLNLTRIS